MYYPSQIQTKWHTGGHIQGITIDSKGYLYCSFTTELVKYDLNGNLIGSVRGMAGHLGCLAIGPDDRIYGSLEYTDDECGQESLQRSGRQAFSGIAFYIAIFDGDKITRMDMDAYDDGIMQTVYLSTVVEDYLYQKEQEDGSILKHRYGCSGIDGVTFAPLPGEGLSGKKYLHVAYGIYRDNARTDNDHQVILAYDIEKWGAYERLLKEEDLHQSGPVAPLKQYFVYTGNTTYGVQNLEYDEERGFMFLTVYKGRKEDFPNYPLYIADWTQKPLWKKLIGCPDETEKEVVPLVQQGIYNESHQLWGWEFPYGATGLFACGDGRFYVSHERDENEERFSSRIGTYQWTGVVPLGFKVVVEG